MPLNEYDPTEVIGVTRQHIQEMLAALNWAYLYFSNLDLSDQARSGKAGNQSSKITLMIERAYNHLEGYVAEESIINE